MECKSVQSSMYFGAKSPQQLAKKAMRKNGGTKELGGYREQMHLRAERELRKMEKADQKLRKYYA